MGSSRGLGSKFLYRLRLIIFALNYTSTNALFLKCSKSVVLVVAILQVVYSFFMYTLKDSGTYLVPAEEFCEDKVYFSGNPPICSRPDMASFQIAVIIPIFFCGLVGFWAWHVSASPHYKLPQTVEGRLFGYLPEAKWLGVFNFSFQLWDFFISLMIPEHATPLMLTHHVLAGFGGYFSMEHQYLHYYGVYFMGLNLSNGSILNSKFIKK